VLQEQKYARKERNKKKYVKCKKVEESIQGPDVILSSLRSNILQREHAHTGVERHAIVEKLFKFCHKLRIAGRFKENIS
jgi:hypothetical protein